MKGFKKMNKFLLARNLFMHLFSSHLGGLNEFTDSLYSSFGKELVAYDNYVNNRMKEIPEELHDDFLDHVSDDYWKYAEGFPQIIGYLFLVRYYSLLEYTLRSIAQNVQNDLPKKIKKKGKVSYAEHYLNYLNDVALQIGDVQSADLPRLRPQVL